jgi:LysM repeat protein
MLKFSVPSEIAVPASRKAFACTLAILGAVVAVSAAAPASAQRFPITPQQREAAEKVASGVALSDLAPNAPSSYTIKRGDTLWGVSTLFLKSPWRWPELWGMNRTQIQNPHLIYPGQTLVLVKTADGRAQLVLAGSAAAAAPASNAPVTTNVAPVTPVETVPTIHVAPHARDLGPEAAVAIPSIPNNQIEPFLSKPLVVTAEELEQYPRIVATQQSRVYLGAGDEAYARGVTDTSVETYHVFRPAKALYDPDDFSRHHPIGYEALYLGTARVVKAGEVTTLRVLDAKEEIGVEDRLVPIGHQELINYVPRAPEKAIEGRIVAVYGGEYSVGSGNVVALNRGAKDGLEIGDVLAVLSNGDTIVDRTVSGHDKVKLPDENVGHIFVFRLFDNISYALLVSASGPIGVGDRFTQPEAGLAANERAAIETSAADTH